MHSSGAHRRGLIGFLELEIKVSSKKVSPPEPFSLGGSFWWPHWTDPVHTAINGKIPLSFAVDSVKISSKIRKY